MTTAPTLPPPLPGAGPAAFGVFADVSLQQESLSLEPSSKVTISIPSSLKPFELRIAGTHFCRKTLIDSSPPGSLEPLHGASWPSWQRFGVMKLYAGVVAACWISPGITLKSTSLSRQLGPSVSE